MYDAFHVGSSPLARGLQFGSGTDATGRGIIPARAGFTGPHRRRRRRRSDHPRSRGVYSILLASIILPGGSSPLARGLHFLSNNRAGRGRIIPARAGFTGCLHLWSQADGDHPRSRGVYRRARVDFRAADGSSPLARGLQTGDVSIIDAVRIIPARAGFTAIAPRNGLIDQDHPRSRGVYNDFKSKVITAHGSSPLARGLQYVYHQWYQPRRIIPARAGFTCNRE